MTLRVGVLGGGTMGADHAKNLATAVSGATVTYIADIDGDRAKTMAAAVGARSTTAPAELIHSDDVDAVVIVSHDSTHAGLILACFEAGEKSDSASYWSSAARKKRIAFGPTP